MPSIFPVVVLCNVNIINSDKKDKILKKINEMNRIKGRNMSAKFDFRTITELQAIEVLNTVPCLTAFLFLVNFFVSKIARKNGEKIWHPHYGACFAFNDDRCKNGSFKQ